MSFKIASRVVGALASIFLLGGLASADPVVGSGVFNLSGTLTITTTSLNFFLGPNGTMANKAGVNSPSSGPFSNLIYGDVVNIQNINTPTGGPVSIPNWINLPASQLGAANDINLDLQVLPFNSGVPVCTGTAADDVPGFTCEAIANSPVYLEQGASGVTALLNSNGVAHYNSFSTFTPFTGKLAANFTVPGEDTISGLLANFAKNGFVTTGYQANFNTTATITPEPASMALLGAGFLALGLLGKKKLAK